MTFNTAGWRSVMKGAVRALVVALAVALGAVPLVLDGCLMTCQRATSGSDPTSSAVAHSCHHANHSSSPHQLQSDPTPCNHDHGQSGSLVPAGSADANRSLKSAYTPVALATLTFAPVTDVQALESSSLGPSPGSTSAPSFALPLRI